MTKLCGSSDGKCREVREVGMGETGVTLTAECSVGSESGLEKRLIPEVQLGPSATITGCGEGDMEGMKTKKVRFKLN